MKTPGLATKKGAGSLLSHWRLLSLLLFALIFWAIFYVGPGSEDSLTFSEAAWERIGDVRGMAGHIFSGKFGLAIDNWNQMLNGLDAGTLISMMPLSALFAIVENNQAAFTLLAVAVSLAIIALIYLIVQITHGKDTAFIAALLWIFFPLATFAATQSIPSQMLIALFLCGSYAWLLYREKAKVNYLLVAIVVSIILTVMAPLLGALLIVFSVLSLMWEHSESKRLLIVLILLLIGSPIVLGQNWLASIYPVIQNVNEQPGSSLIVLTAIIVLTQLIEARTTSNRYYFAWLGFSFFILQFVFADAASGGAIKDAAMLIFWLPAIILVASYFTDLMPNRWRKMPLITISGTLLLFAWLGVRGQSGLTPKLDGLAWISSASIFYLSQILAGVFIIALLLSSFARERMPAAYLQKWAIGILLLFGLALLPANWQSVERYQARHQAIRMTSELLKENGLDFPIYALDDALLLRHWSFLGGYQDVGQASGRIVTQNEANNLEQGNLLAWDDQLTVEQNEWYLQSVMGTLGQARLQAFRILTPEEAGNAVIAAENDFGEMPDIAHANLLYGAIKNTGDYCQAYRRWISAHIEINPLDKAAMLRTSGAAECFGVVKTDLTGMLLDYANYYPTYIAANEIQAASIAEKTIRLEAKHSFYDDPRVAHIPISVKPGGVYIYRVTIATNSPTIGLYWKLDEWEDYAYFGTYQEFTTLEMLIVMPGQMSAETILLSPVMFEHFSSVDVTNFIFEEVRLTPELD